MTPQTIVGDKVLALLPPEELSKSDPRATPGWLSQVIDHGASAAKARLRATGLRSNRAAGALVDAIYAQAMWSGALLSPRTARAMWGRAALIRALPRYRLGDLVVMRDKAPLDLSPLGKPDARLGKHARVIVKELEKPDTGLRLQSVQRYHPRVKTFADQLAKVLATKVNVNGYASLSRGGIFQEHWDAHDVAIVQTHGTKDWSVRASSLPMPIACHRQVLRPEAPQTSLRLQPGSALFLPRGLWHVGEGDESIHLSFGLPEDTVALRIAEVALKTIGRHLQDLAYRAPMFMFEPEADTTLESCFEAYVAELRTALLDKRQLRHRPAFFGRRFF